MFWCRSAKIVFFALLPVVLLGLSACRPHIENNGAFDLKGYLTADAAKLNKLNKPVLKTVYQNGVSETKTVHIKDWKQELGLFIDADINKPTWRNNYEATDEDGLLVYNAKRLEEVRITHLIIKRDKQKVKWILIYTKTPKSIFNVYNTTQKLTYYPDSLYLIEMMQHVKLMNTNIYKVQGKILK